MSIDDSPPPGTGACRPPRSMRFRCSIPGAGGGDRHLVLVALFLYGAATKPYRWPVFFKYLLDNASSGASW